MSETLLEGSMQEKQKPHYIGLLLAVALGGATTFFAFLDWEIATHATLICFVSIIIWQLCEPFADAAQWVGNSLHMPSSVRGATLDAVASSLPEFFIGIFFVLISVMNHHGSEPQHATSGEGFGATVATCAGSAIYNMILIPAFVTLVISFKRKDRPTIDVEDNVIARDGVAFLVCEVVLLLTLHFQLLTWWMGLVYVGMYGIYIQLLYNDWKKYETIKKIYVSHQNQNDIKQVQQILKGQGHSFGISLIEKVVNLLKRGDDSEGEKQKIHSYLFFNLFKVRLNGITATCIILTVTILVAGTSYLLVNSTQILSENLHVPTFFLAVIVVAAASSVADTFVSIAAALRGDDSGAVSNVFGSNIFNICVCLGIPLVINSVLNNWEPISLIQDGKPLEGLIGLQVMLGLLSAITLAMMWHNRQITRRKAIIFCGLYGMFMTYAVIGSLGLLKV